MDISIKKKVTIDMKKQNGKTILSPFIQYDNNVIQLKIMDNNEFPNFVNGTSFIVNFKRADGQVFSSVQTPIGNIIDYKLTANDMEQLGDYELTLQIFEGDKRITSFLVQGKIAKTLSVNFDYEEKEYQPVVQQLLTKVNGIQDGLEENVGVIVEEKTTPIQESITTLEGVVSTKAEKTEVAALTDSVDTINTSLSAKAEKTEVAAINTTLNTKADKTQITTLTNSVNTINTSLGAKADKTQITTLETNIGGINTSLTAKADKTAVDTLTNDVSTINTTLNAKADKTQITTLETSVGTINTTLSAKVNKTELTTEINTVNSRVLGTEKQLEGIAVNVLTAGVVLNDQTKASQNTQLINSLLLNGNVKLPAGDIFINDTIVIPSKNSLVGEKGKTNIKMVDTTKNIVQIKEYSTIRDVNLILPTDVSSVVAGIYINAADNVVFYEVDSVTIKGYAPFYPNDKSCGIHMNGTNAGSVYYGTFRNVTVTNCYHGIRHTKGSGFLNANRFTDLVLQNNKHQMEITGDGNSFSFTAQTYAQSIKHITCNGANNIFNGVIFDLNLAPGTLAYEFGGKSSGNMYSDHTGGYLLEFVKDAGLNNRIMNQSFDIRQFVGYGEIRGVDSEGNSRIYPAFHGLQDNALSFIHKRGTVTLNSGVASYGTVQKLFDYNQPFDGVYFNDPSVTPIEITIDFPASLYSVYMGIIFEGSAFAKDFEIWTKTSQSGTYNLYKTVSNNQRSNWVFSPNPNGYNGYWGIKIKISSAFSTDTFNATKQVKIRTIWASDSMRGGQTFLKQGGGNLYGDLDLNKNKLKNLVIDQAITANRPPTPVIGQVFYDTTLKKPIWYNGTEWTDATGGVV